MHDNFTFQGTINCMCGWHLTTDEREDLTAVRLEAILWAHGCLCPFRDGGRQAVV